MAYLTRIMNYAVEESFKPNQVIEINTESYSYNKTISDKIKVLYKYHDALGEKLMYGTYPWSNNIAKRLECDFSGKTEKINGLTYNQTNTNLFTYLKGKKFTEYIIEVDASADSELLEAMKKLDPEHADEISNTSYNNSKLEIIYVKQE